MDRKKSTIFFLLFILSLFLFPPLVTARAQVDKVIKMELKNEPLPGVLKKLEKASGYKMLFVYDEISHFSVTCKVNAKNISQALHQILRNKPIAYSIEKQYVTISLKEDIKRVAQAPKQARQHSSSAVVLQGRVIDEANGALPGVNVTVEGSSIGTITAADGSFVLQLNRGKWVNVVFSFVGLKNEEYRFRCSEDLRGLIIKMKENSSQLSEVVVTGMFNKRRESYTGAASTVSKEQLKTAGNNNLLSTLSNIDPSFNIVQNDLVGSDPNSLPNVTMRGSTSLNTDVKSLQSNAGSKTSSNLPLFIMDGFEISLERMNDLDENQVESITLLKDASATALYGTRGANGVVVITTKKPETGRLRVTYKGTLMFEVPDLSGYNLMNSSEKLQYEQLAGLYTDKDNPIKQQGLYDLYNTRRTEVERGVDTYWLKYPIHTGIGQKHSLRVEGGDDIFRYSGNVSYNNVVGAMRGSSRNTFIGGVFLSYKYKNLTFQNDLQITSNKAKQSPYGTFSDFATINSYFTPYDDKGNVRKKLEDGVSYSGIGKTNTVYNPLYNALLPQKNESTYNMIVNNFAIEWHLLPELFFRGQLGVTSTKNRSDVYVPAENTVFDNYSVSDYGRKGTYTYGTGNSTEYELSLTANYSKTFAEKHAVYVGLGYELSETKDETYSVEGEGITNANLAFLGAATGYYSGSTPTGTESTVRRIGLTANFNYTFNQCYFLDGTFKTEGSSQFGKDKRFAPFYSVGAGWNIHNEKFFRNSDIVNVARLRVSYGTTGSQSFSPYQALTSYQAISGYNYNGNYGVQLMGIGNNELKWQITKQANFGIDLELFKRRFTLSLDYYNKRTDDLLSDINLPSSSGFSSYKSNVGQVENKGFEVSANAYIIRNTKKNFYWSVGGTMIHNVNKIKKISNYLEYLNSLMEDSKSVNPSFMYKEGESLNTIFAVQSMGIDPSNGKEIYLKKDGTMTYKWDSKDKVACGVSEPKYLGTFNTRLRYKGWMLNAIFSYRFGGKQYNSTLVSKVENIYPYDNADRRALYDRWSPENTHANFKAITDFTTTYATSRFIQKENTLKCSSISLNYEVPVEWMKKIGLPLQYLNIGGYAEDLFYLSTIKQERGTSYPYARSFTFSLTARF
jgi:TonB-linked SusC/RagA family outer membrane protein